MLKEYADSLELEALKGADIGMTISSNPQSRDASEDEVVAATLQPGDSFGELALLTEAPRNATIRMTTPCQLLVCLGLNHLLLLVNEVDGFSRRPLERLTLKL